MANDMWLSGIGITSSRLETEQNCDNKGWAKIAENRRA